MEYTVRVPKNVKKDIEEIIEYYLEERPEYAQRIYKSLYEHMNSLKSFPYKGRIVPEFHAYNINEYRELIESHWRIIYRIDTRTVELFAIIDSRRNLQDILIEKLKRSLLR
jgi:toxin ParE1/3/4